jgi:hypothetical protein
VGTGDRHRLQRFLGQLDRRTIAGNGDDISSAQPSGTEHDRHVSDGSGTLQSVFSIRSTWR